MELSEVMDRQLGSQSVSPLMNLGPGTRLLHDIFANESLTSPIVATTFWQAFIESPGFAKTMWKAGASHSAVFEGEQFVVSHGQGWPRQNLIIMDPNPSSAQPIVATVEALKEDLIQGWERFRGRAGLQSPIFRAWEDAAIEASSAQVFGIVIVPKSPVVFTRCPSPPWAVAPAGGSAAKTVSTAGVVVKNTRNQTGVTAALHALGSLTLASVGGLGGSVVSEDVVSDSCFIEVPGCVIPQTVGLAGPLKGVTPRGLDPVRFEGVASQSVNTIVTAWSPDLPFVLPYSQLKVLTKPDTNPGDSGAALIDNNDHILGFAFYRTGFGAAVEYAAWIWADSVFQAHHLSVI